MASCGSEQGQPAPDSGADFAVADATQKDKARPDKTARDKASPDRALPDNALPDQAPPDLTKADLWICGNKVVEGTEECDGSVPAGKTCRTEGFTSGTLACDSKTCKLDVSQCMKAWPLGKDGVLKVGSKYGKAKVTLWPGEVKDYSEVIIDSDGLLEVIPGNGWVIIGVNGNLKLDGKIVSRRQTEGGTITAKLPDANGNKGKGPQISHALSQQAGGVGGGASWTSYKHGGASKEGNGGGGGSTSANGGAATITKAGDGANGDCASSKCPMGGKGATQHGSPGLTGDSSPSIGGAAGGGGGFRGYHGGLLYLQVRGDVSGTGTFDLRGSTGGAGGAGGKAGAAWKGSGGGGGGAGGSGGRLMIKLTGVLKMLPSQFKLSGAVGGGGGANGPCPIYCGTGGGPGKAGIAGSWSKVIWTE